jgi:ATP-binding cassette subfamily C protein CydC
MMRIRRLIAAEQRGQRGRLAVAGLSAAVLSVASVLLLGLSGWFITGAALAGLGGASAALAFNVLLPSAGIRLLAILRTGCRYAERLTGHDAAFRALAHLRPLLYRALAAAPPSHALALSAGEAVARIVQDVDEIEARFVRRSAAWGAAASGFGGAALLLLAGPWAAAGAAAILLALVAGAHGLAAALHKLGRAVPQANGLLKDEFASLAVAAPELCAYGLEAWAADRIDARAEALLTAQRRVTAAAGWLDLLLAVATGLVAMLALALSRGALPVAALSALGAVMMIDGAAPYLRGLQRQGHLAAAEERLDMMLQPPPARAAPRSCSSTPTITLSGAALPRRHRHHRPLRLRQDHADRTNAGIAGRRARPGAAGRDRHHGCGPGSAPRLLRLCPARRGPPRRHRA